MATIISTEVVAEYESSSRPGAFYKDRVGEITGISWTTSTFNPW